MRSEISKQTKSANAQATARAAVAFCDGKKIYSFVGETAGTIAPKPRGLREFYWDTIFMPDLRDGTPGKKTYSEIVGDKKVGLVHKMKVSSQSSKAMTKLLDHLSANPKGGLWR